MPPLPPITRNFVTRTGKTVRLILASGPREVGAVAANIVRECVGKGKRCVLGLPTGATPLPLYHELVSLYQRDMVSFKGCTAFTLDEYRGLPPRDRRSFRRYMERNFFSRVDIPRRNIHSLNGLAHDPEEECRKYEEKIREAGGIRLMVLGIGINGHLAYNEPRSSRLSRTRMVLLSGETRRGVAPLFKGHEPPHYALTMGLATILSARRILLLAIGKEKALPMLRALREEPSHNVPASFLQTYNGGLTVILDRDAAGMLLKTRGLTPR